MTRHHATQAIPTLAHISAGSVRAASSYVTDAVDASRFERLVGTLHVGTLSGGASVNLRLQHNSTSVGSHSGWADINSACVTPTYGSASNGKIAKLELNVGQRPEVSRYVRGLVSAATSSWQGAATIQGYKALYEPGSDVDHADVGSITVY